jgi:hypothetical protein
MLIFVKKKTRVVAVDDSIVDSYLSSFLLRLLSDGALTICLT